MTVAIVLTALVVVALPVMLVVVRDEHGDESSTRSRNVGTAAGRGRET